MNEIATTGFFLDGKFVARGEVLDICSPFDGGFVGRVHQATVERYRDFGEAIAAANASRYGLQAGIFTRDHVLIMRAFEELEVGGLIANDVPTFRSDQMPPYGGVKESGSGREGVRYAIEEMTERKVLVV